MPANEKIPDYYDILGLYSDADSETVKKAYRSLAKAFHPDTSTHPNAVERFRWITEAYDVLSDNKKREEYDSRYNHNKNDASDENSEGQNLENDEFSRMADYEYYSGETEHFLINGKKQEFENLRHIIIGDNDYIIVEDEMINIGGIHRFTHKGEEKYLIDGTEYIISNAEHYYQNGSEFVIIDKKPYMIKSL